MPELPEVETTRRGLTPHVIGRRIVEIVRRRADLRFPIPAQIDQLIGEPVLALRRRAKYLLLDSTRGSALLHLGMSGSLRIVSADAPVRTHDHVDLVLASGQAIRFHDPRRFGCLLWQPLRVVHPLLATLGPEPLEEAFDASYLAARFAGRSAQIKTALMDQRIVVGVGNIYASEALYRAGIDPRRAAGRVSRARLELLVDAVKEILAWAIGQGGTTLRDFVDPAGTPGYFAQSLKVYERAGEACLTAGCGGTIERAVLGQRASYFCRRCQR
jgi:formamidopyrimidine-DNA glycosylase